MANEATMVRSYAGNPCVRFDEGGFSSEKRRPLFHKNSGLFVAVATAMVGLSALAGELVTWQGGNLNDPSHWSPARIPTGTDIAVFDAAKGSSAENDITGWSPTCIRFVDSSKSTTKAFTLGGNAIKVKPDTAGGPAGQPDVIRVGSGVGQTDYCKSVTISAPVTFDNSAIRPAIHSMNCTLTFSDDVTFSGGIYSRAGNASGTIAFKKAVSFSHIGIDNGTAAVELWASGNKTESSGIWNNTTLRTHADYALVSANPGAYPTMTFGNNGTDGHATLDLYGHPQRFAANFVRGKTETSGFTYVSTHIPAVIYDRNADTRKMYVTFQRAAGYVLEVAGTKTFFTPQDSVGTVGATAGTIVLDTNGTWKHAHEAIISGSGSMTINDSNALGCNTAVKISGSGTFTLADGVKLCVDALYVNGVKMADGVWGSEASGAPNTDSHFAGTGKLYVSSVRASEVWNSAELIIGGSVNDKNGNGKIDAGDLVNLRNPAKSNDVYTYIEGSTSDKRPNDLLAKSIHAGTEDVLVSSAGNVTLVDEPVLVFDPPAKEDGGIRYYASTFLQGSLMPKGDRYSVLLRFKPDFSPNKGVPDLKLFQSTVNEKCGIRLQVNVNSAGTGGSLWIANGTLESDRYSKCLTVTNGVWHEVAVIVDKNKVTIGLRHPLCYEEALWNASAAVRENYGPGRFIWQTSTFSADAKNNDGSLASFADYSSFSRIGTCNFDWDKSCKGLRCSLHLLGQWNRVLDPDEVLAFFSDGRPAVFRVGPGGVGSAAEEMCNGTVGADVTLDTNFNDWSKLPPRLVKGSKVTVKFDLPASYTKLGSFVRIDTAVASVTGAVAVSIDGRPVGTINVVPGEPSSIFADKSFFRVAGAHVLTIERVDSESGDLKLNGFELRGSWQLGLADGKCNMGGYVEYDFSAHWLGPDPIYLTSFNLRDVRGHARFYQSGTGRPDYYPAHLVFDLDKDMVGTDKHYFIETVALNSINSSHANPGDKALGWSFNGGVTNWYSRSVSMGEKLSIELPVDQLKIGRNEFSFHADVIEKADKSSRGDLTLYFDYYRLRIKDNRGLVIMVQ